MASHDSSWDIFRSELKRWMELRRVTNKELARALNADLSEAGLSEPVDEQIIKRWRHSTAPPLQALKVIARTLAMSPDETGNAPYDATYLPRTMGVLEAAPSNAELIEAAYRLQSIRARLAEAQGALASATADEGIISIVRAAMDSSLACAVVPALEGPPGYPMRVSDRLDIREITPGEDQPDLTRYPLLEDALEDAFAIPSRRMPRFAGDLDPDESSTSMWAVQYLGRPRSSMAHSMHQGLPALVITSVTTTPWIDDIGDLVALVLGYGFTTTRELARELVRDPYASDELRRDIHENFLYAATPMRRVWSHYGASLPQGKGLSPFRDAQGRATHDLVQIFLEESDASLSRGADVRSPYTEPLDDEARSERITRYQQARDELSRRASTLGPENRVFTIPVDYFSSPAERWEQVFRTAASILTILESLGVQPLVGELHDRMARHQGSVGGEALRWFADHDAPFVEPRLKTVR